MTNMDKAIQSNVLAQYCAFVRPDGQRCRAKHLRDSPYCLWHDDRPDTVERRMKASAAGGKHQIRDGLEDWKNMRLELPQDVTKVMAIVINQVGAGKMDCRIASAITQACNVSLKSIDMGSLEERIRALEKIAGVRR